MPDFLSLFELGVVLIYLAGVITVFRVLLTYRTEQAAVAWILGMLVFPFIALPAYVFIGKKKFLGYVHARISDDRTLLKLISAQITVPTSDLRPTASRNELLGTLQKFSRFPATGNNQTKLLTTGTQTMDAMFRAIHEARDYILVEFYIINEDLTGFQLKEKLIAKAQEGIRVYVIYDEIGSSTLSKKYLRSMRRNGIDIRSFGSLKKYLKRMQINFRNHRKILVVDGVTAFTGGLNIGDEYSGLSSKTLAWRDTHLQVTGPAVLGLQLAFLEDWYWVTHSLPTLNWCAHHPPGGEETVLVLATGPADPQDYGELCFLAAIHAAQTAITIASPYFVPTESVLKALELAVKRGVKVDILIPRRTDHWIYYFAARGFIEDAERAGIHLQAYQPRFMHQKILVVDEVLASVGTSNFDVRSMRLNFEVNAVLFDKPQINEIRAMLARDFEQARPLTVHDYKQKPLLYRIACRTARLFSPVL